MFLRKQAVAPRYDTRDGAMILKQIADRLGLGSFFPYENMTELVQWQLEGTGFSMADFEKKGFVAYGKKPIFWNRQNDMKFKTPSGKIEFKSSLLEDAGFESFPAYQPVPKPSTGSFRLVVGRNALHTHISTQNNPYLNDLCSENVLWINDKEAEKLGITDGEMVRISSKVGEGEMKAKVTDLIHGEAVFMLHGFGHEAKSAERSYSKGVADSELQESLKDKIGGSPALHDTFVTVAPV
jgi:thiosulfate reductase/polysulfide reductase chain A